MSAGQCISKHSESLTDSPIPTECKAVDHIDPYLPQHPNDEGDGSPTLFTKKDDIVNSAGRLGKSRSRSSASDKRFKNRTSFKALREPKCSAEGLSCEKKPQADCGTDVSPEIPVKLVSSMKGSREKQGISPKKLSVTWAPDVYDPIPTSVSHVPNNNQNRRRDGKKYRKNKKKGGAGKSDANKNNDKKQPKKKKKNGGTNNCKPMPDDSVGISEPQSSILDFDGAALKPSCGESFFMASVEKLHYPVAEAS